MEIQELVKKVVAYLVDQQSEIKVTVNDGKRTSIIEVEVAEEDTGKIIGKDGKTAEALRTVVSAVGSKTGKRYLFQIIDNK